MSETISLDQNNRQVVRGIVKASSATCSVTSAADVYVHVITKDDTAELYKGDGTVIPKATKSKKALASKPKKTAKTSGGRSKG